MKYKVMSALALAIVLFTAGRIYERRQLLPAVAAANQRADENMKSLIEWIQLTDKHRTTSTKIQDAALSGRTFNDVRNAKKNEK